MTKKLTAAKSVQAIYDIIISGMARMGVAPKQAQSRPGQAEQVRLDGRTAAPAQGAASSQRGGANTGKTEGKAAGKGNSQSAETKGHKGKGSRSKGKTDSSEARSGPPTSPP
eukprot:56428-Amphidinium_carterae.1